MFIMVARAVKQKKYEIIYNFSYRVIGKKRYSVLLRNVVRKTTLHRQMTVEKKYPYLCYSMIFRPCRSSFHYIWGL